MTEGYQSDYPEPNSTPSNPYPAIDPQLEGRPIVNQYYGPAAAAFWGSFPGPIFASPSNNQPRLPDEPRRGPDRPRGSGRGKGRGGWKRQLIGTEHEDLARKPREEKVPRGRGRGRGAKRGRRGKRIDPGREFVDYQRQANQAFLENRLEEAHELALSAVKANPEVFAAHSLLSQILAQMGREKHSISALMMGAITRRVANDWNSAAERTLALSDGTPREEAIDQALHCYQRALSIDKKNREARVGKLRIFLEQGDVGKARLECKGIAREHPEDLDVLRQYAELCAESNDVWEISRAKDAYEKGLEFYADQDSLGDPAEQWSYLNVYLDLVDKASKPDEGILQLKRLARWLLGRRDEFFWDKYTEDDREFDLGLERRGQVGEVWQGRASQDAAKYGSGLPLELRVKLGIFRLKMGMRYHDEAMRHLEHVLQLSGEIEHYYDIFYTVADNLRRYRVFDRAIEFYEPISELTEVVNAEFFVGLGECYCMTGRRLAAAAAYEDAIELDPAQILARVELAKLYETMGMREKAVPLVEEVLRLDRREQHVRRPPQQERNALASVANGETSESQALLATQAASSTIQPDEQQVEDMLEESEVHSVNPPSATPAGSTPVVPEVKSSKAPWEVARIGSRYTRDAEMERSRRIREQEPRVISEFDVTKELWSVVMSGTDGKAVDEWIQSASRLVEAFHLDCFYTGRMYVPFAGYTRRDNASAQFQKEMVAYQKQLRADLAREQERTGVSRRPKPPNVPIELHGISFSQWHRVFVNLALLHAQRGQQKECYGVLNEAIFKANVFCQDDELHNTSMAAAMCCGLTFNDSEYVIELSRKLINDSHARASMPFQLLSAVGRLCYGASEFMSATSQKFMLRCVRNFDHIALPSQTRDEIDWGAQTKQLQNRLRDYGHVDNKELDAGVLAIYGHMVANAHQSFSALPYYFRALALQPDNVTVNLCIAVSFVVSAMKRQSENRQHNVAQGLSFLERYSALRKSSGSMGHLQEVEFNWARMWHMLGLMHLAIPGYEKVLELSDGVRHEAKEGGEEDTEDFALEAAFALQQIFAVVGNQEAARKVTEAWLVL